MWDEPKSDENTNVDERILRSSTSSDSDFPKQLQMLKPKLQTTQAGLELLSLLGLLGLLGLLSLL